MRIWNLQDKIEEAVLKGHTEGVTSVAIAVNGKYTFLAQRIGL